MGDSDRLGIAAYRAYGDHADLSNHHRARGKSLWNAISRSGLAIDAWAWRCKYMLLHPIEIHRIRLSLWGRLYGDLSRSFTVRAAAGWPCAGFRHDGYWRVRAGRHRAAASPVASAAAF